MYGRRAADFLTVSQIAETMFGHGSGTLPLSGARSNDKQFVEISDYTEEVRSSDAEQIIEYEIITVGGLENKQFTNLENILPDDAYNDNQDSISKCKMFIEELSLSPTNPILSNGELKNKKLTYLDNNLPNDVYNDDQDSLSRCKMFIEEISLSPTSYKKQLLFNNEMKNKKLTTYLKNNIPNNTYNDNQDSISRRKISLEELLSPPSFKDRILPNGELKNKKLTYLENNLPNYTYNDNQDSTSRCKMFIEKLSPSSNTNHVSKKKNDYSDLNHLIECVIDDAFEENKQCSKAEVSLDDAFRECLVEINADLSIDDNNIKGVLNQSIENNSSTKTNHKRKISHSDEFAADKNTNNDNDHGYSVHGEHNYFKQPNKKSIVDEKIVVRNAISEIDFSINNFFYKPSEIEYFKRTCDKFLQRCICLSLPSNFDKCIDCCANKMENNLTKHDDIIQCRFYAFRQLKFTKGGKLVIAGYPDPQRFMDKFNFNTWISKINSSDRNDFSIAASKKILQDVGGQFCNFAKEEIEALKLNLPNNEMLRKIIWKQTVKGVREMCDVCKTTIFNHHWSCSKCGFVVCVDCFRTKRNGTQPPKKHLIAQSNVKKMWLLCSDQRQHQVENLSITQILPGNTLHTVSTFMHNTSIKHNIPLSCSCNDKSGKRLPHKSTNSVLNYFLNNKNGRSKSDDTDNKEETSAMQAIINDEYFEAFGIPIEDKHKYKPIYNYEPVDFTIRRKKFKKKTNYAVAHVRRIERLIPKISMWSDDKTHAPHMWLCEGHLLRLLDPKSDTNYTLFQEQWKLGQPVLVSDVGNNLSSSLWHPESFSRDFGNQVNDLINCNNGDVIPDQPMSKFWNGFENSEERLCDKQGDVMLLKLKDWPPSADFAEKLPDRFQDLMNCLPLKEYTHRNGVYNLASHLPESTVRPDLGPKMYTAYGNAGIAYKQVGTTNLHLDISDAVNVMVYVAITKNCKKYDYDWYAKEALQVIEEAGCDDLTMRRIYEHREIPGALWHIYHASDADSIRDLLHKVSAEHGTPLELCGDPIHDQSHYLDEYLRDRLFKEYGVKGYTIVQYFGDAVFIPAGAPHQVRNLHNCIKVAEDFVSPENVHQSFRMTQEFRHLTDSHTNHEDKLQIKHIVYHAIRDAIAVLLNTPQAIT